jgi:crotonobetainyl-CoA:carnitine CoA-transferase CaiB-like acyl-CoA transferase
MGLMDRSSRRSGIPTTDLPLSVADTNAGLHGLVGILSAVIMRERTGLGQHVDIAMVDATVATDDQLIYDLEASEGTSPLRNDAWQTPMGPILISGDFRYLWRLLQQHHGVTEPAPANDSLEAKIAGRRAAVAAYMASLGSWEAVEASMKAMNLAWGRVRPGNEVADQITLLHRGAITQVDDRAGGTRPFAQSPYRFSNAKSGVRGPAPHRGEHNAEVLKDWLGRDAADAEALETIGVLSKDEFA